ncbi:transposable element Tcb1 transposase [Trichonephila clavipes]|nr:transposable element Tcb1 transposase [Trichonephila clavipes]
MFLAEVHLGSRYPLRVLPLRPNYQCLHLKWCHARGNWTAAEWNPVVFRNDFRFNPSSDDNRVRVWRPRGELLIPAFALQRHTAPTAMVWGDIAYNTRSTLVLIHGTMTASVPFILYVILSEFRIKKYDTKKIGDGLKQSQMMDYETIDILQAPRLDNNPFAYAYINNPFCGNDFPPTNPDKTVP